MSGLQSSIMALVAGRRYIHEFSPSSAAPCRMLYEITVRMESLSLPHDAKAKETARIISKSRVFMIFKVRRRQMSILFFENQKEMRKTLTL